MAMPFRGPPFCIILDGFVSAEGGFVVLSYFRVRAEDDLNI